MNFTLSEFQIDSPREKYVDQILKHCPSDFQFDSLNQHGHPLPIFTHTKLQIPFIYIPHGTFRMGFSPEEEAVATKLSTIRRWNPEAMRPLQERTVLGFLMSLYPVATQIYTTHSRNATTGLQEKTYPVLVQYRHAQEFADLFQLALPSEVQWEYACRAGTTTIFVWGESPYEDAAARWVDLDQAQPSSEINFNNFGLAHLFTGEWCSDIYRSDYSETAKIHEGEHVVRGGAAMFWPWQDAHEWVWCMPAMRMAESGLLMDKQASFRLVYNFNPI